MVLSIPIASFTSLSLCVSTDVSCKQFPFSHPLEDVTKAVELSPQGAVKGTRERWDRLDRLQRRAGGVLPGQQHTKLICTPASPQQGDGGGTEPPLGHQ